MPRQDREEIEALVSQRHSAKRRRAYELDVFWPPPFAHRELAEKVLSGDDSVLEALEPASPKIELRRFADAPAEVRALIDPTWQPPKL